MKFWPFVVLATLTWLRMGPFPANAQQLLEVAPKDRISVNIDDRVSVRLPVVFTFWRERERCLAIMNVRIIPRHLGKLSLAEPVLRSQIMREV